jgi:hypothetical protein
MKVKKLPLPEPWNADTAVSHLYRVWSNQGRVPLRRITLLNPNMVQAIHTLWQQDQRQAPGAQSDALPSGVLAGIGSWRLLQEQDGSGVIIIESRR